MPLARGAAARRDREIEAIVMMRMVISEFKLCRYHAEMGRVDRREADLVSIMKLAASQSIYSTVIDLYAMECDCN